MQAEVSILDEQRRHAYTIVGQSLRASVWNTAYLGFRAPTPNTYLESAFFNPQQEEVQVDLDLLAGQGWERVDSFTLAPLEMRKLRVPATRLATARSSADRTALFRATYSVSVTELVANAWLEDETTGFSNTVLFHEARPASNRLYGAQLVAYGYPRDLLPDGPSFEGHLVLANIDQQAITVTPTLYCDLGGEQSTHTLPALELEPESIRSLSLNQILADDFGHATEAVCSAEIEFTGAPGTLLARYFGESSTLTYGLYSKLEAGLGHAFNELYWNVEGDRTPLLTVTNFSDTTERIDIWATRDSGSRILRTVELPAKASVHINMQQEFTQRSAELESLKSRNFGGYFIRAQSPTAKVLVKEHIFSQSRQVASPYYGFPDQLFSHDIYGHPSWMTAGSHAWADTHTCYQSGCYINQFAISSQQPSIISVTWNGGPFLWAQQPGHATLHSVATGSGEFYGTQVTLHAFAGISVYDSTPVINAIVPNTIPAGQTRTVEIWGLHFGTNPSVQASSGITVGMIVYSSPNQINVQLTHNPGFPPGQYSVWVTSSGFSGSGYQSAPGGGSQAQSNQGQITALAPTILSITPERGQRNSTISVSINGLHFTAGSTVAITGIPSNQLSVQSIEPQMIQVSVDMTGVSVGTKQLQVTSQGHTSNSVSFTVYCAIPVNFRKTSQTCSSITGILRVVYQWDSSSGVHSELHSCTIREVVRYPGGATPESPPFPMFTFPSPTILSGPATAPFFEDSHIPPSGNFVQPYSSSSFVARQDYEYNCSCEDGSDFKSVSAAFRDVPITRSVLNDFGTWKYRVTKKEDSCQLILPQP